VRRAPRSRRCPYRLSALAEQDLDEIWFYVAEDASPTAADRLIDAIIDRFELLAEQPRMGRLRPEFGAGVRSFTVESHVIYYRHEGEVLIARVLHGRRDQAAATHRENPAGVPRFLNVICVPPSGPGSHV
jgi:toxin ParE1/3/4